MVFIPHKYDPEKTYKVHFSLHGGVATNDIKAANSHIDRTLEDYKTRDYITVYPSSWFLIPWWQSLQYDNLNYILDKLKNNYNINENEVHLSGISDGSTGTYYLANCNTTPWASVASFLGDLNGIGKCSDKQIYISNFKQKPFFIINTGQYQIFLPETILPYISLFENADIDLSFHMIDSVGHSMSWYLSFENSLQNFYQKHIREPYPDKLFWESEFSDKFNRKHWLIINKLGRKKGENQIGELNTIPSQNKPAYPRDFFRAY